MKVVVRLFVAVFCLVLFTSSAASAQSAEPFLVKDINQVWSEYPYEREHMLLAVDDTLYFDATDRRHGWHLWKSDGTEEGTVAVDDVVHPTSMIYAGGWIYMKSGFYLYQSDGQAGGEIKKYETRLDFDKNQLIAYQGTVFFQCDAYVGGAELGYELCKIDSATGEDILLKDIDLGGGSSRPSNFVIVNDLLFFTAFGSSGDDELWRTDGTTEGTVLVKATSKDGCKPHASSCPLNPEDLIAAGDYLFFRAYHPDYGSELWRSDGTPNGTFLVKDIFSGADFHPRVAHPRVAYNGLLYFAANDGINGNQLWESDGTESGTVPVTNFASGEGFNEFIRDSAVIMDDVMYFCAYNNYQRPDALWRSDGTKEGTWPVKEILFGTIYEDCRDMAVMDSTLYFVLKDPNIGKELWRSDGTEEGTYLVKDIYPGIGLNEYDELKPRNGEPKYLTTVGNTLFFRANNELGNELWKSDGTEVGTVIVKDIDRVTAASNPSDYFTIGDTTYFVADDGIHGRELWKSDATTTGTVLVKDIYPGIESAEPSDFVNVDGLLFFVADDGDSGRGLWRTDGTDDGTYLVRDFVRAPGSADPHELTGMNGQVYFVGSDEEGDSRDMEKRWYHSWNKPGVRFLRWFG